MQNNKEISNLEQLPDDILAVVLNFMSEQEKIDTIIQLRLVCRQLCKTVSTTDFLKNKVKSQILDAKFRGLCSVVDKNLVLKNQIEDWQALKLNIINTYESFYNKLPQIQEIKNLINQIKQTSLPAISYMNAFRTICLRPKVLLAMFVLFFIIRASVKYSIAELPKVSPLITQQNKLERELIEEGCTFESSRHGQILTTKCNDTLKENRWQDLENEIFIQIFIPVMFDTVSGMILIVAVFVGIIAYMQATHNQPRNYEDLSSANLYPRHHVLLTNIRNKFPNFNPITPTIKDIRIALEKLLADKDLPTNIFDSIQNLGNEYLILIKTLDAELKQLEQYQKNKKVIMNTKLINGEQKASFRGKVYSFFSRCHKLEQEHLSAANENSEEAEKKLIHRTPHGKLKKRNGETPLLHTEKRDDENTQFNEDQFRFSKMV